jgi:hypothetical protein
MKNHLREFSFNGRYWPYLNIHIRKMLEDLFTRKKKLRAAVREANRGMQKAMDRFLRWEQL